MKSYGFLPAVIVFLIASFPLQGQEAAADPRDELIASLLSEREGARFQDFLTQAKALDLPRQVRVEARFLYHVDKGEHALIAAMVPELEALRRDFSPNSSEIFSQVEDFEAIISYAKALGALETGDDAAFKSHITEAFWLSPQQAGAFAPHIERFRIAALMKTLRLDLERPLKALNAEADFLPRNLLEAADSEALVLHFWSPWSREVELSMEDFKRTSAVLQKADIPLISVLLGGGGEDIITDARAVAQEHAASKGHWVVDHETSPLAASLRVSRLPTMVIVAKDGSIRFNGSPVEAAFWDQLRAIDPSLRRPARAAE